ncbi:MAG TPA: hypothetical protein VMB49_09805 [Acidobacteriaceae bacterium]|nr:hypothetical protein [Acidobacteriaceae bacterium]
MKTFQLRLMTMTRSETISGVVHFTGRDASGSFGIRANASRRITVLVFGLAHYQSDSGLLEYLALPGGLLYFLENELRIATTHFVRNPNLDEITAALDRDLRQKEAELREIKQSLRHLDEEILKRMYTLKNRPGI